MNNEQMPWKIGAIESGRVAIDDAQDRQVTGWIEPEDAERILKAVNAHHDLLEALEATNMLLRTKRHACEITEVCHVLDTHIKRNQAAIAKARGEA